jgi:hypothetical protein
MHVTANRNVRAIIFIQSCRGIAVPRQQRNDKNADAPRIMINPHLVSELLW